MQYTSEDVASELSSNLYNKEKVTNIASLRSENNRIIFFTRYGIVVTNILNFVLIADKAIGVVEV